MLLSSVDIFIRHAQDVKFIFDHRLGLLDRFHLSITTFLLRREFTFELTFFPSCCLTRKHTFDEFTDLF